MFFRRNPNNSVAADRYKKNLHEKDTERAASHYIRAGLAGAALGLALRKPGVLRKTAALHGAGAGVAVQAATRIATGTTKDRFGDRSPGAKQVDRIPTAALAVGAVVAGHKRIRAKLAPAMGVARGVAGTVKKTFMAARPGRIVRFDMAAPVEAAAARGLTGLLKKKVVRTGIALTGGIAAADAVTSAATPKPNESRIGAAGGGLARGALYGGVLSSVEPLINTQIISSLRKKAAGVIVRASARQTAIHFDDPKEGRKRRVGGLALAGAGALALPAAVPFLKIMGRSLARKKAPNEAGKFVADYLTGAQRGLNSGIHGKVAGAVIQQGRRTTQPGSLNRFMTDHYARFRAGHREALKHWGYEVGESMHQGAVKRGMNPEQTTKHMKGFLSGQTKAHAEIDQQLWHHGKSESEAIAHVGHNTQDPEVRGFFRRLAVHKAAAVKTHYGPLATIAPASVAAGAGLYASGASAEKKRKTREMNAILRVILFSAVPPLRLGESAASAKRLWLRKARRSSIEGLRKVNGASIRDLVAPQRFSVRRKVIAFALGGESRQLRNRQGQTADPIKGATGEREVGYWEPTGENGKKEFNPLRPNLTHHQVLGATWRQSKNIYRHGSRGVSLLRDAPGALSGEKSRDGRKNEWHKAYVKAAAGTAVVAGARFAHMRKMANNPEYRQAHVARRTYAQSIVNSHFQDTFPHVHEAPKGELGRLVKSVPGRIAGVVKRNPIKTAGVVGAAAGLGVLAYRRKKQQAAEMPAIRDRRFSRIVHPGEPLYARGVREIRFGWTAPDWDVRDQRGRSARVFAPGAGQRERREKKWHERVSNIRKVGLLGTVAGLGVGAALGYKLRGRSLKKAAAKSASIPMPAFMPHNRGAGGINYNSAKHRNVFRFAVRRA